jgi:AraC family transcriptional regulator
MEWIEHFNRAINYIEDNLSNEIRLDTAARIACCNTYHFQRMFAYMTGIPLSEYIRRRKMSLAAEELRSDNSKVIDVSVKYGYDSPTAFNRAFRSIHGIAPSQAKEAAVSLKAYPPISISLSIKGDNALNYRIEQRDAFRIIGISMPLHKEIEKNFETVPRMWGEAAANGTIQRLAGKMDGSPMGLLGISFCNEDEDWRYYIAVASGCSAADGFEERQVPASVWAIFEGEGSSTSIQELEKRIVIEWLPTSGYEYNNAPDIEVYINPDPQNARYEVWIPVKRKEG